MAPPDKVQYTARARTTGGRNGGASRSADGRLDIKLSVPGTQGTGANPEQLFAAGWSSCFVSPIKTVAGGMKIKLPPAPAIDAEVDLCRNHGGLFPQARIKVSLPGIERELAHNLLAEADQICPYSKAARGNIDVAINLTTPSTSLANVAAAPNAA
jgi:osmotically inducible protein OsmC